MSFSFLLFPSSLLNSRPKMSFIDSVILLCLSSLFTSVRNRPLKHFVKYFLTFSCPGNYGILHRSGINSATLKDRLNGLCCVSLTIVYFVFAKNYRFCATATTTTDVYDTKRLFRLSVFPLQRNGGREKSTRPTFFTVKMQ